jgi:hypothetical protein
MTNWTEDENNRKNWKSNYVVVPVYESPYLQEDYLIRSRDANTVYLIKNKTRHMIPGIIIIIHHYHCY